MKFHLHAIAIYALLTAYTCAGIPCSKDPNKLTRNLRESPTLDDASGTKLTLSKDQIELVNTYKAAFSESGNEMSIDEMNKYLPLNLTCEQEQQVLEEYPCYFEKDDPSKDSPADQRSKRDVILTDMCQDKSDSVSQDIHINFARDVNSNVIQLVTPDGSHQEATLNQECKSSQCQGFDNEDTCTCRHDMKCRAVSVVGYLILTENGNVVFDETDLVLNTFVINVCSCHAYFKETT